MTSSLRTHLVLCAGAVLLHANVASGQRPPIDIPLAKDLTIVFAVHAPGGTEKDIAQGDYETVVTVGSVDANGITVTTRIDGASDGRGRRIDLTVNRRVSTADLAGARAQVLGFNTEDPLDITGTTSLGPSLAIMRDIRSFGRAEYSVYNYYTLAIRDGQAPASGTLIRTSTTAVPFPVLVNGRRVDVPAIRVTGQLKAANGLFPWEQLLLDDSRHPLTLRWAYGRFGEGFPFTIRASRDVVRIDFPAPAEREIETALSTECRVEMPGIYFDFDRATLKPESNRALTTIAGVLRQQPQWRLGIEGHTDNSGTDAYNDELSVRRAAAVKTALVRNFAVASERLTSTGFGARRPVETNDTIAGRARNRRVELVRNCQAR